MVWYILFVNELVMKSTNFFIEKSKSYIAEIEKINSNYVRYDDISFSEDDPYVIQQKAISDLILKIKLMLSEFDKSEILLEKLKEIDESILFTFSRDKRLNAYKSLLGLFIDHLNEFRSVDVLEKA